MNPTLGNVWSARKNCPEMMEKDILRKFTVRQRRNNASSVLNGSKILEAKRII
jgi:hypothetical protein